MYTDMDSILYQASKACRSAASRWFSSVEGRELNREELYVLYGCWADDAARSDFLRPVQGTQRKTCACVA